MGTRKNNSLDEKYAGKEAKGISTEAASFRSQKDQRVLAACTARSVLGFHLLHGLSFKQQEGPERSRWRLVFISVGNVIE